MKKKLFGLLMLALMMSIEMAFAQHQKKTPVKQSSVTKPQDVYIGGHFNRNGKKRMAGYLKNGVPVILTDGQYEAEITAMAVIGNDVYAVGVHNDRAVQWKNGQEFILTPGALRGRAYGIAVFKGDIYVVGASITKYYDNVYWKNGQVLGKCGVNTDEIMAIAVDNNGDVYVADRTGFWKNGTEVDIVGQDKGYFSAYDLKIVNGKIYSAGYVEKKGRQAAFWEGGKQIVILPSQSGYSYVSSMDIVGNDVYLVGWDREPKYWKNGLPFNIGEGLSGNANPDRNMIAYINKDLYIISLVNNGLACLKNGKPFLSIDGSFIPKCLVGSKAAAK